jgi:serine/threonine-protein kinase RsbT
VSARSFNQTRCPIGSFADVENAWRRGLEMARRMGFPEADANKIAVVISELGRNIEQYAGRGSITLTACAREDDTSIQIVARDKGPGIPDVERVLAGGYSTSRGLGIGVSGSRQLMDEFAIQSVIGAGTTIKTTKLLREFSRGKW